MSKYGSSRQGPQTISGRTDKRIMPLERLDSTVTKLCDLHVYKVPPDLWRENFNNILNNVVTETISIGIIRVPSETRLADLRDEIIQQLQPDDMGPRDWVFLRSVGRSLTRLRSKQEYQLKAKHFLPPVSFAPELYILEATPEVRDALAISERGSSQSPPLSRRASPSHRGYPNSSYRNGYNDKFGSSRDLNRRPDDDSGVAEMSPDDDYNHSGRGRRQHGGQTYRKDDYDMLAKRLESESLGFGHNHESEEDQRRRLEELEGLSRMDGQRWDNYQDERRRQAEEDRRREEDERRRREDEEKRRREEEEEKRRREEDLRLEEERRKRKEEEEALQREEEKRQQAAKEEADRLREELKSPDDDDPSKRDTESARQRRREEKLQLLRELEEARQARQEQEKEREELVKKAKALQHKTTNRRNDARDMWKKKYFEEKKKTAPLEENSNRLRQELEALHRRLMNTLEGPKDKNARFVDANPSQKSNYVIQCTKLQHDIEDLQRRVSNAKMKLTAEMKLRGQAQTELKAVRTEAMQNRLTLKLATGHARPAKLAGPTHATEPYAAAAQ